MCGREREEDGGQRTTWRSRFSPFTKWIPESNSGIRLGSKCLTEPSGHPWINLTTEILCLGQKKNLKLPHTQGSQFTFYCCDKHHNQNQHGEEGFTWSYSLQSPYEGKPEQESGDRGHGGALPSGLSFIACSATFLHNTEGPPVQEWQCSQWAGLSHIYH